MAKSAEQIAVENYLAAGKAFTSGGAARYEEGDDLTLEELQALEQLGPSGYEDISVDPRYKENEMEALHQLEEQSRDGFNAQDKADLARIEQNASRANRGRQGAIRQEFEARGLGGSGLVFALRQQAAQDAAEQEALQALEVNAQAQNRKQNAAAQLGSLSGQLSQRDYAQQAQKAEARDAIARFNTQNSNARQQYNTQTKNDAQSQNWQRSNQVKDNNTNADYNFRRDTLGVNQGNATTQYNYANDLYNREQAKKAEKARKKSGMGAAIGGAIGTAAGAYFGGPVGAAAGASLGSSIGGSFAHGGKIEGPEIVKGDHPANDVVPIQVSGGEYVIPKSKATPMEAAKFIAEQQGEELDPVALLLEAMSALQRGRK